nr:hypothetical protein [Bacteroidaceae bacterium]
LATGKYIAFVDSDDSLTPNTLSEAMRAIEGAEVVEFPVVQGYLSKHAQRWEPTKQTISFEEWMRRNGFTHCYACNKVFARSLWQDIEFPAGRIFEDIRTIPRVLQKAKGIRGSRDGAYLYCDRENSISKTLSLDKLQQYVEALLELMSLPEAAGNTALYLQALNGQISYHRMGGKGRLVPPSKVPWAYVFKQGLTAKQRIKALWFKLTYR